MILNALDRAVPLLLGVTIATLLLLPHFRAFVKSRTVTAEQQGSKPTRGSPVDDSSSGRTMEEVLLVTSSSSSV